MSGTFYKSRLYILITTFQYPAYVNFGVVRTSVIVPSTMYSCENDKKCKPLNFDNA